MPAQRQTRHLSQLRRAARMGMSLRSWTAVSRDSHRAHPNARSGRFTRSQGAHGRCSMGSAPPTLITGGHSDARSTSSTRGRARVKMDVGDPASTHLANFGTCLPGFLIVVRCRSSIALKLRAVTRLAGSISTSTTARPRALSASRIARMGRA